MAPKSIRFIQKTEKPRLFLMNDQKYMQKINDHAHSLIIDYTIK